MSVIVPMKMDDLPPDPVPYWAATSKGWFINTPTLFGVAQVITDNPPEVLPQFEELFRFNGKKLPLYILSQAHDFFRKVWNKQKTESSAYICHNPGTDDFKLFIPEQYVTSVSVNHKLDAGQPGKGYQAIGTIHSHCDFSAFHSGTDTHDMGKMPGLHITLGHVDREEPEIAIAMSIADRRFDPIEYDTIIDKEKKVNRHGYNTAPDQWLRFVKQGTAPWTGGNVTTTYSKNKKHTYLKQHTGYQFGSMHKPDDWGWDYEQTSWNYQPGHEPKWLVESRARKKESDDAFKTFDEEITVAEDHMEYLKEVLCMYGFVMNFNITHNPERADEFLAKYGKYSAEELLAFPNEEEILDAAD